MRQLYFCIFILFLVTFKVADAADKGKIKIEIHNIEDYKGTIRVGLYNSSENYDNPEKSTPFRWKDIKPTKGKHAVVFDNIPFGTYAIALYHDVNNNRKLDKNFLGMPTEPYGFSTNFKPRMGTPRFEDISFKLNTDYARLVVSLL